MLLFDCIELICFSIWWMVGESAGSGRLREGRVRHGRPVHFGHGAHQRPHGRPDGRLLEPARQIRVHDVVARRHQPRLARRRRQNGPQVPHEVSLAEWVSEMGFH